MVYFTFYFILDYFRVLRVMLRCQYVHRTRKKSQDLELKYEILYSGEHNKNQFPDHRQTFAANSCVCVCVFFPFILDFKFVGSISRGHAGFLIHLPSAVRAFIFFARRIQPFLSLVDREVELRKNPSYRDSNSRPNVSEGYEVINRTTGKKK